ncbi:hypothetical protein BGZ79_005370, partial [Entomortierella chlamydospora]
RDPLSHYQHWIHEHHGSKPILRTAQAPSELRLGHTLLGLLLQILLVVDEAQNPSNEEFGIFLSGHFTVESE